MRDEETGKLIQTLKDKGIDVRQPRPELMTELQKIGERWWLNGRSPPAKTGRRSSSSTARPTEPPRLSARFLSARL